MLNNPHPRAWELNTTGFEWSITSSAKYAPAMWCTSGQEGFFRNWNLRVAHPAVVLSPPVINELFCNYREVTWRKRAEQLIQNGSLRFWKGSVLDLPPRFCSLSLLGHTSEWTSFTSHSCASAWWKKIATLLTRLTNSLGDWQLNRIWCFLGDISFSLPSDCQIGRWPEISRLDIFWKTLLKFKLFTDL